MKIAFGRVRLSRLPVVIGAVILLVPWFFFAWNITIGALAPKLFLRTEQTLVGVLRNAAPKFTFDDLVSYRYQRQVSQAIGIMSPVYRPAIRFKSQFYFSVLGMSATPPIVIGLNKQLYQREYLDDFCKRDLTRFAPEAKDWVSRVRDMQEFFTKRGVIFLYVITPSKPVVYPEFLPPGLNCPSSETDRRDKIPLYRQWLDNAGIHYVDLASAIGRARYEQAIPVFPRGGIHWNMLSAAIGAQAVTIELNTLAGSEILTPFEFDAKSSFTPVGSAKDLTDLLNLAWPDLNYEVPIITLKPQPRPECRRARITEVGGSFLFELNTILAQAPCPPEISDWFYWDTKFFRFPGGTDFPLPIDATERRRSLLDTLDVMIFEENEAVLPRTPHGKTLLDFIAETRATAEAGAKGNGS